MPMQIWPKVLRRSKTLHDFSRGGFCEFSGVFGTSGSSVKLGKSLERSLESLETFGKGLNKDPQTSPLGGKKDSTKNPQTPPLDGKWTRPKIRKPRH